MVLSLKKKTVADTKTFKHENKDNTGNIFTNKNHYSWMQFV